MMAPSAKRESEGLMPSVPSKTVITRNRTSATISADDGPNGSSDDDPRHQQKGEEKKANLNSHYGNLIGFLQTLSLTLNAAMMIYAHVGLSGVVYSSQDPDIISGSTAAVPSPPSTANNNPSPTPAPPSLGGNFTGNATNVTTPALVLNGDCEYDIDLPVWIARGGFENRKFDSNYCAREYNGGCLLGADCLQECFREEFGYTPACSVCFANINPCVSQSSCLSVCAGNSLGDTCQTCLRDTPCDSQFYECSGLPKDIEAFMKAQEQTEPERTGACNDDDKQSWIDLEGLEGRGDLASYCALEYTHSNGNGCLIDEACIQECIQSEGFSPDCSVCFANISPCIIAAGCLGFCAVDSASDDCMDCLAASPCDTQFFECTGLPEDLTDIDDGLPSNNSTNSTTNATMVPATSKDENDDPTATDPDFANIELGECPFEDLEDVQKWYVVYNLTFAGSIQDAWTSEVYGLAIMIVVFSGIWPYAKNIALVLIWFIPMTDERRSTWLLWLSRLSKYTLVDVYAVIMVLVGVQLDLNIGGITAIIRAEARFAIIAFLLATVWEFIQIEWMKVQHHNFIDYHKRIKNEENGNDEDEDENENDEIFAKTNGHAAAVAIEAPETNGDTTPETLANGSDGENESNTNNDEQEQQERQQQQQTQGNINVTQLYITLSLTLLTVVLYIAGAAVELIRIENYYLGTAGTEGCVASYNLATVANPLVNEVSFQDNNHKGQHWTLYIFYIVFALALPISVHLLQITFFYLLTTNEPSTTSNKQLFKIGDLAGILWGMASVEVFLLGLFAVEYKFEKFIKSLAGEQGAQFIDVQSFLGPGFIILIIYSIVAGMLQYYVRTWFMEKLDKEEEVVEEENMNGEVKVVEETNEQ